jgi:hypothetical protein
MTNRPEPTDLLTVADTISTAPQLSGPKRQHFLPKFYLEGFTKNGMVAIFDRGKNEVRVQTPVNTCVIGHFYTMEDSEGRKRFELEQLLSDYESKANFIIKKLEACEEINAEERANLAIFVAFAAFRTPDNIDSIKLLSSSLLSDMTSRMFADVEEVKEGMRGMPNSPSAEEDLKKEAIELVEFVKSGQYKISTNHTWAVGMAMKMAFIIAPIFAGRNWMVIHRDSEKKSFVTTDAPVLLTTVTPRANNIYGIGFGNADAFVMFPLNQSCILAMYGNQGTLTHQKIDAEQIRKINLAIAAECQRFIVARDEELVRSIKDYLRLADKKWQPKMQPSGLLPQSGH